MHKLWEELMRTKDFRREGHHDGGGMALPLPYPCDHFLAGPRGSGMAHSRVKLSHAIFFGHNPYGSRMTSLPSEADPLDQLVLEISHLGHIFAYQSCFNMF
jgi:hypothetical protein